MLVIDQVDYFIVLLEDLLDTDYERLQSMFNEDKCIYVPMDGESTSQLNPERFLVKNPQNSFRNHLMWEGLFDPEEQSQYIEKCCKNFWETGKKMVIEDYDYQEDEPFYDYSK